MTRRSEITMVAMIGAGTIARGVGERLGAGAVEGLRLHGYMNRSGEEGLPGPSFATLEELLVPGVIVVEAASHQAVQDYAEDVLSFGADFMCVSVGALASADLRARLAVAAAKGGSRLIVPSGAVGGLDVLRAAAEVGLDEVVIEQRKPPRTLLPEPEASELREPLVVFDGTVQEVVLAYPKTTNVAASVALAGLGFERTRAIVVADPALSANRAILRAQGSFGSLTLQLDNVASTNPKTSMIVAHSVVATLRRQVEHLVVPG